MQVTIYHNPRCSKSRQTLALLQERGIAPRIVEYLKEPPDADRLDWLLQRMERAPREAMRQKEPPYRELGLAEETDRGKLIAAMVAHPILIERPIVVAGDKVALGRPPEAVLDIL
jgi:arsenate reductase